MSVTTDGFLDALGKITGDKSLTSSPSASLSRDEDLAVRTIIGEAKGEGQKGWEGVADVIRNRAKQSGKGFGDVVLAPNQFEPWSSRKKELEGYDPNSPIYRQVASTVLPVLRGERTGPAGNATHFYSPSSQKALGRSAPSWDNGKGIDIGNHRFFNLGYSGKGKDGTIDAQPDAPSDFLASLDKITSESPQRHSFLDSLDAITVDRPLASNGKPLMRPEDVGQPSAQPSVLPPTNPTTAPQTAQDVPGYAEQVIDPNAQPQAQPPYQTLATAPNPITVARTAQNEANAPKSLKVVKTTPQVTQTQRNGKPDAFSGQVITQPQQADGFSGQTITPPMQGKSGDVTTEVDMNDPGVKAALEAQRNDPNASQIETLPAGQQYREPIPVKEIQEKDAGSAFADIIDIPDSVKTAEQARAYVLGQLQAKHPEGKFSNKDVPLQWEKGDKRIGITYDSLKNAGVDTTPLIREKVVQNRVENPQVNAPFVGQITNDKGETYATKGIPSFLDFFDQITGDRTTDNELTAEAKTRLKNRVEMSPEEQEFNNQLSTAIKANNSEEQVKGFGIKAFEGLSALGSFVSDLADIGLSISPEASKLTPIGAMSAAIKNIYGKSAGDILGKFSNQAKEVYELSTPDQKVYKIPYKVGGVGGDLVKYAVVGVATGGNPVLTFAIGDAATTKAQGGSKAQTIGSGLTGGGLGLALGGFDRFGRGVANAVLGEEAMGKVFTGLAEDTTKAIEPPAAVRRIKTAMDIISRDTTVSGEAQAARKMIDRELAKSGLTLEQVMSGSVPATANLSKALATAESWSGRAIARKIIEKGVPVGLASGTGYGMVKAQGGSEEDARFNALLFGGMQFLASVFHKSPNEKFTPEEVSKVDGATIRVPDEQGKPATLMLTDENGKIKVTDVTGQTPEGTVQGVVLPKVDEVKPEIKPTEKPVVKEKTEFQKSAELTPEEKAAVETKVEPETKVETKPEPTKPVLVRKKPEVRNDLLEAVREQKPVEPETKVETVAEKGVEEKPVVDEKGADNKSTTTVMDDRSPKSNWREKYDETPDLMGRHDILRAIADTSSDKEASDVLDRIKDEKYGNASNVAWDVAHNPKISQAMRDRAQKMYDAIYPPMTPEQRIETDRTNKQRLIKSMEAENAAMLAEANGKPKKAIQEYIEGNKRRIAKAQSELQSLSPTLPADKGDKGKEPWQMSKAEFAKTYDDITKTGGDIRQLVATDKVNPHNMADVYIYKKPWAVETYHRSAVKKALADGQNVPPEVLADYPDLATKAPQPTDLSIKGIPDGTPMVRKLANGSEMRGTLTDNGTAIQLGKNKQSITSSVLKDKWKPVDEALGMARTDIIDSKGKINEQELTNVARRIESGELAVRRFNPEVERGRIAGGKRNVEASLILARDAATSEKANASRGSRMDSVSDTARRQEGILEKYAKQNDIWFKQGHFPDRLYIDKGGEAIVYRKSDDRVVKLIDPRQIDKSLTPQTFLDNRVTLFNYLFPESRYEVMGFMRDDNGKFRVIVTQPFIQGEPIKQQSDVDAFMASRGLNRTDRQSYGNDLYEVHDLHEKNVIKAKDGTIYVIDAVPKAKHVEPFEVTESLAKARTDEDKVRLAELNDKYFDDDTLSKIKTKATKYGTEVDLEGLIVANRIARAVKIWKGAGNFDGLFMNPEQVQKFVDAVDDLAHTLGDKGKGLTKMAKAIEKQFKAEGVAVLYAFDDAARHEGIHKADYLGSLDENGLSKAFEVRYDGATETLAKSKPFEKFTKELTKMQGTTSHGVAMAEALAWLGDGNYEKFRLTEQQSVEILATLAEGYATENGIESLDGFKGDTPLYEIINDIKGKSIDRTASNADSIESGSERETGQETIETAPNADGKAERQEAPETDVKPRRAIESANLAGVSTQGEELYPVKSVEGNKREAQETIERIGLTNATTTASLPLLDSSDTSLREHVSLQMQVAETLFEKELQARADGNTDLAEGYRLQKEQVITAFAMQGTDIAQALRQFGEWRIFNPETVDLFINLRRMRAGLEPLAKDESAKEESDAYRKAVQRVAELEAQIEQQSEGKQQYEVKGKKTKPLTKTEKKVLDNLKTLASDSLTRLNGGQGLAMASHYTVPTIKDKLGERTEDDLTNIGASMLLEGWRGEPMSVDQFTKELEKTFKGEYKEFYPEIHAKSIVKMDKMIADARRENAVNAIKAENPKATDAEIEKILGEKKAESKVKSEIRAEHRKLSKQYLKTGGLTEAQMEANKSADRMTNFLETAATLDPNASTEVLVGAALRGIGKVESEIELQQALRERFPEKFKPEATDQRAERKQKLHDLDGTIALSMKLFKETNRELQKQRAMANDAKNGISPEQRRQLEKAKRERTVSLNNLESKVQSLTQPTSSVIHAIAHTQRGLMVMALRTAITNWWSTGLENMAINKPITLGTILLRKAGLRGEENGLTADASILTALMTPKGATDLMGIIRETLAPGPTMDMFLKSIDEHPEYYAKFFGDFSPDFHTGMSKYLDKFMFAQRWQEFNKRGSKAMNALALRASQKGISFRDAVKNDDWSWVTKADMDYALHEAKQLTYALKPKKGTDSATESIFAYVGDMMRKSAWLDLLGANTDPFNNFIFNIMQKLKTKMPVVAQVRTVKKVVQAKRANPDEGWSEAAKNTITADAVAHQFFGIIAFATAIAAVRALGDRDEWYYLKVPYTKGMGKETKDNPGGYLYFDVRSIPVLAPFVFTANKMNRIYNGKDPFTYANSNLDIMGEIAEGLTGISYRGTIDNSTALNALGSSARYAALKGKSLISGVPVEPTDRTNELAMHYISKFWGQQAGNVTNLIQAQTFKAIVDQYDKDEQHPLNLDAHPFWQGIDSKLPESRRILQKIIGDSVKPRENYATGEQDARIPIPILKVLGVTLYDGSTLRPEPSQASILAAKLRYGSDAYAPPVLADDKKKAAIKRDFRRAGEQVQPNTPEATALQKKLESYNTDLSQGAIDYAKRGLFTTDLQDNFKGLEFDKAALVWKSASIDEKNQLAKIFKDKLTNVTKDKKKSASEKARAEALLKTIDNR